MVCEIFSKSPSLEPPFCTLLHRALSTEGSASALALLRKKTGYSISNCKKALEVNNKDVAKAEAWLNEQAQAQGWAKATRLQSRTATQGLVGVAKSIEMNAAIMVEVNCETDFVARNEKFHSLVSQATQSCLRQITSNMTDNQESKKVVISAQDLSSYAGSEGSLADLVALNIGMLGENLVLRRAVGLIVLEENGVQIVDFARAKKMENKLKWRTQAHRLTGLIASKIRDKLGTWFPIAGTVLNLRNLSNGDSPILASNPCANRSNSRRYYWRNPTEERLQESFCSHDVDSSANELLDTFVGGINATDLEGPVDQFRDHNPDYKRTLVYCEWAYVPTTTVAMNVYDVNMIKSFRKGVFELFVSRTKFGFHVFSRK
nr:EOG090X0EI4 [Triops cancriformis]